MVRKGEYLERSVVVPHASGHLEGLYHRGGRSPGVVFAPPAPLQGGGMESAIIAELAWAVTRAGHPTLRFNYPGIGASQGAYEDAAAYGALVAAAHHLRICVAGGEANLPPIGAVGIGMGAALVARLALEGGYSVAPIICVSPVLEGFPDLSSHRGEVVLVRAQLDDHVDGAQLMEHAAALPHGRATTVPKADAAFVRGLVDLGRIVAETLAPPGLIDLGR